MDISALSMDLSQYKLQTSISYELLSNVQELSEIQAEAITEMLNSISMPGIGEHIDISL